MDNNYEQQVHEEYSKISKIIEKAIRQIEIATEQKTLTDARVGLAYAVGILGSLHDLIKPPEYDSPGEIPRETFVDKVKRTFDA